MNKRKTARKAIAVLLLLAMILGLTVALPVGVSAADPAGITDFSYQTLSGATLSDSSTDLRFLFKIDSLDYEKVGFVFSKSDSTPTIGEEHCGVYETTSAYSAINAGGDPQSAGENHWWVAVKLAGIPKVSFGQRVYVVGFVKAEGEDPVYSEARSITACAALGHDYEWTKNADTHAGTCSICGDEVAESGHNFSMSVSGNVATYTCLDCGYSFATDVNTSEYEATPTLGSLHFNPQGDGDGIYGTISRDLFDSDGDSANDCVRSTLTNTNRKYWLNYVNGSPTYADGKTNVISFKNDIRIASGATPANGDLSWFYYSFSGFNDQGYGFRFRQNNAGKIEMKACNKESTLPVFDTVLEYDTWYSIRCDVTVTTSDSTHTLQSIKMYVNDQLVHTVNLENMTYSSYSTTKVRMMITGISGATVTYDIKNIGVFVGAVQ